MSRNCAKCVNYRTSELTNEQKGATQDERDPRWQLSTGGDSGEGVVSGGFGHVSAEKMEPVGDADTIDSASNDCLGNSEALLLAVCYLWEEIRKVCNPGD
jgi:hypothetical protein